MMSDPAFGLGVSRFATVNGLRLHYVEAGSADGPLVVLLHGFPEFWYGWRQQIPALAAAGFRVVAPDLRGYNLSDKPTGKSQYRVPLIVEDIAGLIRSLRAGSAHVVGHDWGGAIAWALPVRHPTLVDRLVVLNTAPTAVLVQAVLARPRQLLRSWYIAYFQIPVLPEAGIRAGNYRGLRETFRREPARRGAFTETDIDRNIEALARPGALTAMINYYRAINPFALKDAKPTPIDHPTLLLWGNRDRYIGPEAVTDMTAWATNFKTKVFPNATHWVQHDEPEGVNANLIAFLRPAGDG